MVMLFAACLIHPAAKASTGEASLDSHVHVPFEDYELSRLTGKLERFLAVSRAPKILLLSPAYIVGRGYADGRFDKMTLRYRYNELTAQLVQKSAGRALGLCGMGLTWTDADRVLLECLNHEGMVGIKIRDESLVTKANFKNLHRALMRNKAAVRLVLHHFYGDYPWAYGHPQASGYDSPKLYAESLAEVKAFVGLAKEFPGIQFIAAHSLNAPNLTQELTTLIKAQNLTNVWLELSTAVTLSSFQPDLETPAESRGTLRLFSEAWRHFGLDHVLFGSDKVLGEPGEGANSQLGEWSAIRKNSFLANDEKETILRTSGTALLRTIGSL